MPLAAAGHNAAMTVTNHVDVLVAPERIFDLLADPDEFARIAGGRLTEVTCPWPRPGSRLSVRFGRGRLGLTDKVAVRDLAPRRRIELRGEVGRLLVRDLRVILDDRGGTTCVTTFETPSGGLLTRLPDGLVDRAIGRRNAGMLARLRLRALDPQRSVDPERPGVAPEPAATGGPDLNPARLPHPRVRPEDQPLAPGEATHPEIDLAERSGRGDPYAGLRDGGFEYEARFAAEEPDSDGFDFGPNADPNADSDADPDGSTRPGRPSVA